MAAGCWLLAALSFMIIAHLSIVTHNIATQFSTAKIYFTCFLYKI